MQVTAITFVALGTSLPDTFASRVAAVQERTADNSVGNVTGSNGVNVFLGLGIPWLIAAIFWESKGMSFAVPAGSLAFRSPSRLPPSTSSPPFPSSVMLYSVAAVIAVGILLARRFLPFFGNAELGWLCPGLPGCRWGGKWIGCRGSLHAEGGERGVPGLPLVLLRPLLLPPGLRTHFRILKLTPTPPGFNLSSCHLNSRIGLLAVHNLELRPVLNSNAWYTRATYHGCSFVRISDFVNIPRTLIFEQKLVFRFRRATRSLKV